MRIIYPYNEILPKKKAHDVFIFNECAALANLGWEITLLCGKGSEKKSLPEHYQIPQPLENFRIEPHFIVRKNNPLNLSWNLPFFFSCQQAIRKKRPDYVFLSVRKQGEYHLSRKVPGVKYLYEVHELSYYPNTKPTPQCHREKEMLSRADLITVTTNALKEILENPPYSLKVPIHTVPLAVSHVPLPPPSTTHPFTLMYVGQLYEGQGVPLLLSALKHIENITLKIVGGTQQEIARLTQIAKNLRIQNKVKFLGFIPPAKLPSIVKEAHAFVSPFENRGRMPYVAHTKLFEYATWGRPIIAPALPIVQEHFQRGALLFEPGNEASLANSILEMQKRHHQLQEEMPPFSKRFTWSSRTYRYQLFIK